MRDTATDACNPSSVKYKENIADLSYGLAEVLKLRPVSFDYKPELLVYGHQVGLIAEEVYEVVPEVVGLKDGAPDSIHYAKLTSVLVRAVQELYAQIKSIQSQLMAWAKEFVTDRLVTKELCVEDICVTRDQFMQMVQAGTGSVTITSTNFSTDSESATPTGSSLTDNLEQPTTEENTATATESTTTDTDTATEPIVEEATIEKPTPTSEPQDEPEPESESEPEPAPEPVIEPVPTE